MFGVLPQGAGGTLSGKERHAEVRPPRHFVTGFDEPLRRGPAASVQHARRLR